MTTPDYQSPICLGDSPAIVPSPDQLAAARRAINTLVDTVSLRDFGAVGDGVTDDSAAINAAIAYVLGQSYRPAIYCPPGNYLIGSPIVGNASLDLTAQKQGVHIFGHSSPLRYGSAEKPTKFTISGSFPSTSSVFDMRACSRISFRDIGVFASSGACYALLEFGARSASGAVNCESVQVRDCNLSGGQYGIYANGVSQLNFREIGVAYASVNGMLLTGSGDAHLDNLWFNNIDIDGANGSSPYVGAALAIVNGSRNINVRGGKVEQCYKGILLDSSQGLNVTGVNFDQNLAYHIMVGGNANTSGKTANLQFQPRGINIVGCRFLGGGTVLYDGSVGKSHIVVSNYGTDLEITVNLIGNSFSKAGSGGFDLSSSTSGVFAPGPINSAVLFDHAGSGNSLTTLNSVGNNYNDCSTSNVRFYSYTGSNCRVNSTGDTGDNVTDNCLFPIMTTDAKTTRLTALFAGSWTDYGGSEAVGRYWREGQGVRLSGMIKVASGYADGQTMFTLPSQYRPSSQHRFSCPTWNGAVVSTCSILVANTGVASVTGAANGTGVILDGITVPIN